MFSITPVAERPSTVVDNLMKMFEGELAMEKIEIEAIQDRSNHNILSEYMMIDTSRLIQVLINLLCNAIKFTAPRAERKISLVYGAQKRRPPHIQTIFGDLHWVPPAGEPRQRSLPSVNEGEEPLFLYFCVQDTGKGMTDQEMAKLFKRFSQATPKTHITYGGSGLGLYICRQLAEKQGGGVGVASRSGEGSVFGFYIESTSATDSDLSAEQQRAEPLSRERKTVEQRPGLPQRITTNGGHLLRGQEEARQDGVLSNVVRIASNGDSAKTVSRITGPEKNKNEQARRYNVLLVEDNLVNQKVLAKQLRMAKCTVTVANHGKEALEALERTACWVKREALKESAIDSGICIATELANTAADTTTDTTPALPRFDVILMDWEMPVMSGLECCRRIRELEQQGYTDRHTAIIATTANVRKEQQDQALEAGMDSVMSKPFTIGELMGRIEEVLGAMEKVIEG